MYGQVEPSCTVERLDLWVVRFDLYSGKAAMEALLGPDHLSMRQKSHTLDRAASPSPLLIFWKSYNDCIIINSVGQRVQIVCCVSILFLASWFACDAGTITSPLTLHILWIYVETRCSNLPDRSVTNNSTIWPWANIYLTRITCILNAMSK